jgi:hemerythrin-like domain-containing protein
MDFQRQTTRRLHQEHEETFDLCTRIERTLAAHGRSAPAAGDETWKAFARRMDRELDHGVMRHFEFEERELFPLLEANSEGAIAQLLLEEHDQIRECAREFRVLLGSSCETGIDQAQWTRLSALGAELAERLVGHAQKEDMALLPALDDILADEQDNELFSGYVLD